MIIKLHINLVLSEEIVRNLSKRVQFNMFLISFVLEHVGNQVRGQ